ncbi:TonB-like protein [Sphingobacterium yanglingense]|uniref:TonB-like protein n=2 Tax=Sphingobacterium yanglingense TaxID=1437280 RepID=A0A4R6WTX5_9SPHI|nr:TonB-like protein [Sphingobacterium yanglingense]
MGMKVRYVMLLVVMLLSSAVKALEKSPGKQDTIIVPQVDVVPQFKGGVSAWNRFLQNRMNISELVGSMDSTAYVTYGTRQTAVLEFTVCEDGEVCDVVVLNRDKISPIFEKEVLRVMSRSPKWEAATKDGKPVRTKFKQTIMAILD